jgi:hypothetical protein
MAPSTPASAATLTAPTAAPVIKPASAPAASLAPPPVIVGGNSKPLAPEPVILNKGADGGCARVVGEPVIVSEPRSPLLSRILKPSDNKVTTVLTTTPASASPAKGQPTETDNGPKIVTGPVSAKATASATCSPCNECASTGAPRPGVASRIIKPTPPAAPVVKAAPMQATHGDWRESWGRAVPPKNATVQAATVAPRPTAWTLPPDKPADSKRADRIVFPKPDDRKPDPLSDPASYSRLARHDLERKPSETTGAAPRSAEISSPVPPAMPAPVGRRGPQPVQVAATEGNAFSPPQPATPPPTMANAWSGAQAGQQAPTAYGPPQMGYLPPGPPMPAYPPGYAMARPPYYPPMSPPVVDAGTPTGMGNAFTPVGNTRPIPADFAPPQFAANGFSSPAQQEDGAGPTQPVPPPLPGYFPPMAARGYGPAPYATGYGPRVAIAQAGEASVPQLLATLHGALLPSQRELAAERLADLDWRTSPQVVDALVTAAHADPAATVRAGCVRSLAKMKVNTVPVVAAVEGLKRDADPRVRLEAEEALTVLGGGAPRNDGGVRPASASGLR